MRDRSIGELVLAKNAGLPTAVTAAGTGDATEVDGSTIDRQALGSRMDSVQLVVHGNVTLTSGKTLSIAMNLQDSPDDSTWTDFGDVQASTVVVTATGGALTASDFADFINRDIRGANRYIRAQWTPDLNHTGTDTAMVAGTLIFGGAEELPAA